MLNEAVSLDILAAIVLLAVSAEIHSRGMTHRGLGRQHRPSDLLKPIGKSLKSAWKRVVSQAEQGDPELEAIVSSIEDAGAKQAADLSPEQIATIQEKFGDDNELAQLLSQLPVSDPAGSMRQEIVAQIVQHIKMKPST